MQAIQIHTGYSFVSAHAAGMPQNADTVPQNADTMTAWSGTRHDWCMAHTAYQAGLHLTWIIFCSFWLSCLSSGRSKGYAPTNITYNMTPQLHTSAVCMCVARYNSEHCMGLHVCLVKDIKHAARHQSVQARDLTCVTPGDLCATTYAHDTHMKSSSHCSSCVLVCPSACVWMCVNTHLSVIRLASCRQDDLRC